MLRDVFALTLCDADPLDAVRQQGAGVVSGSPHRAAQHGVGRRENVFVAKPGARTGQQRGGSLEPPRRVFEEPRQPFTGGGIERAQTPVLTYSRQ